MTKIAIMQPYFFSNLGYYQLINSVDVWVNLDHVSFMKRSWMTHNFLKDGIKINIPCSGASQNKSCREVNVIADKTWRENFIKTLKQLYYKEPNYKIVSEEVLNPFHLGVIEGNNISDNKISISNFNLFGIQRICTYLDINTVIRDTSEGLTTKKKNEGLQDIVKYFGYDTYINAIGGQALYTKEDFKTKGIDLKFIKNNSTLPNTSILDLLFRYDKEVIKQELNNYELI